MMKRNRYFYLTEKCQEKYSSTDIANLFKADMCSKWVNIDRFMAPVLKSIVLPRMAWIYREGENL
jgi:hypothetical protein